MHQILFGVKRVHLLGLALSRALLRDDGRLTPARFDMMRIVHVHGLQGVGVPQANIRLVLGVSGATVSRMLKALQQRGYIVRNRVRYMRGLIVRLTNEGRSLIKSLMAVLVDNKNIDHELDEVAEPRPSALRAFDKLLQFFRDGLDDPAPFDHPWHCGLLNVPWPPRYLLSPPNWLTRPRS